MANQKSHSYLIIIVIFWMYPPIHPGFFSAFWTSRSPNIVSRKIESSPSTSKTHRIHLLYMYLYIWLRFMVNVGTYTVRPMDPMSNFVLFKHVNFPGCRLRYKLKADRSYYFLPTRSWEPIHQVDESLNLGKTYHPVEGKVSSFIAFFIGFYTTQVAFSQEFSLTFLTSAKPRSAALLCAQCDGNSLAVGMGKGPAEVKATHRNLRWR